MMDVSNMLSTEVRPHVDQEQPANLQQEHTHSHQYPTRRSMSTNASPDQRYNTPPTNSYQSSNGAAADGQNPGSPKPKNVAFELHFDGARNVRGRLPMRVQIFPHDTTDSIVTTVKNFYGIYDGVGQGVSFEDVEGHTLIASYENFTNDMIVYVRVIPDYSQRAEYQGQWGQNTTSPHILQNLDDGTSMLPPQPAQVLSYGQPPSRPGSRISRKQSASPKLNQGRSNSIQKSRSKSGQKGQGSSFQAGLDELNSDVHNGYSSSDGGAGSVTSSRKARSEQLASAEISVDNIVVGGRRKKAKFESSVSGRLSGIFRHYAYYYNYRNFLFSFLPKCQPQTPSPPFLLSGVRMALIFRRHSPDLPNAFSHIICPCSLHKATHSMIQQVIPCSQSHRLPSHQFPTTATVYVIVVVGHHYLLALH